MSNLKRLLEKYQSDQRTQNIIQALKDNSSARILIQHTVGAQDAFILAGTYLSLPQYNQVIIASDKEEAAYLQNTLDNLLTEEQVMFFPDSFRQPMNYEEINKNHILQRTETINKINLNGTKGEIIVTYPEAVFEKVVDPELIAKNKIEISKDESLDVDTILYLLVEYGFESVEYVFEPGQFSVRGGIIDIFSFGSEWPYRIELFDELVESVRMFNPMTQLSVRSISKFAIIPHISKKFKQDEKISLFDVFSPNTVVWIRDLEFLLDKLQICFEKTREFAKSVSHLNDEDLDEIFSNRAFMYPNQLLEGMTNLHTVLLRKSTLSFDFQLSIEYQAAPQPSFNKNFNFLIDHLRRNEQSQIETFLFTENKKQIERFYKIFEDLNAHVQFHPVLQSIHAGFIDKDLGVACFTDHQIFERFHRYRLKKGFTKEQALNLKMLRELQRGDYVVHIDHGVGKFSGLEKININGHVQESVRLIYKNNDLLYVSINSLHKISKYIGREGTPPKLDKIGSDAWKKLKRKTKSKVKDIAKQLIKLYAKRKASKGFAFAKDDYLQNELEASFIYEDTADQLTATQDIKTDMEQSAPMDRLICGDVGFGKTEVAIRATFKAVVNGKQAAVLVPTTILALQHYKTFKDRLEEFGIGIEYVNRFKTAAEKTKIYQRLVDGKIDVIIGTHALLNKKVRFKDLGLLVVDEEQKFGVAAKEKLRNLKVNVDTLTLTATPIPRTLQFSLMGARDLSIIKTAPPNRQPIHTERRMFSDDLIKDAIYYEINRGGQVFFVHNRIRTLPEMVKLILRLCPDIDVAMAHGQMESKTLERTLIDFIDRRYDVLVCTNIIETGLDIPNANTILINNGHQFGLSDLHQLRGRVGRSNKKAYCYLFVPPLSVLTSEARKRLKTVEEFSDLGSGFNIAMRDLDIRGAGNLLGAEQSGFIADIGYETYQKILEEAIHELKDTEFKDLFRKELEMKNEYVKDVEIETDIEMLIPDEYISNIQERFNLYSELDKINDENGINAFRRNLKDRFGSIPEQVNELFNGLRLRWICKGLGIERLSLKNRKMRCYMVSNAQSSYYESQLFKDLLNFISLDENGLGIRLKQSRNFLILVKDNVRNLKEARRILNMIRENIGFAVA